MARTVRPDSHLAACPPRSTTFELPFPINERLEQLAEVVTEAGYLASKKDVVSALILSAPTNGSELGDLVLRFRAAKVKDAEVTGKPGATVATERLRKPGPRRRRVGR